MNPGIWERVWPGLAAFAAVMGFAYVAVIEPLRVTDGRLLAAYMDVVKAQEALQLAVTRLESTKGVERDESERMRLALEKVSERQEAVQRALEVLRAEIVAHAAVSSRAAPGHNQR